MATKSAIGTFYYSPTLGHFVERDDVVLSDARQQVS
jgi:hypothetical protein